MNLYPTEPASLTLLPYGPLGITCVSSLKYLQHSALASPQSFGQLYLAESNQVTLSYRTEVNIASGLNIIINIKDRPLTLKEPEVYL